MATAVMDAADGDRDPIEDTSELGEDDKDVAAVIAHDSDAWRELPWRAARAT